MKYTHRRYRFVLVVLLAALFLAEAGCGHLMHPQAESILAKAKGETGKETALNLVTMMESTVQQAKNEVGRSPALERLHEEYHVLRHAFCDIADERVASTAYDTAMTLNKEMATVFHRLWKYQETTQRRAMHLDLFGVRLNELRDTLSAL